MNTYNEHRRLIARELEIHGVVEYRFEHKSSHPRVVFVHRGREQYYVFSLSASCRFAGKKIVAGLRRMLGVRCPAHKNPGNRKRRGAKQPRPPGLPGQSDIITVGADPWAVLKNHPLAPKGEAAAGGN